MQLIERSTCAVTGANDLEHLYTFKDFPVFMGCTTQAPLADFRADMGWWISQSSGLIQLNPLLPLDVLYPESHGAGVIGALWQQHHQKFAEFISIDKPNAVFEIGGSHGILEKEYQAYGAVPWTILEPNPAPHPGTKAKFIRGFFDQSFKFDGEFDVLVHSHVFEHIYQPLAFMQHLSNFVPEGKALAFSIPNMHMMLKHKYNNCINFEHTIFLTESYIEYLLSMHGFSLKRKEYFLDDHSIFYYSIKGAIEIPRKLNSNLYKTNKQIYQDYIDFHLGLVNQFNSKINATKQPVYLFGAHVFSQYLLSFGLDTTQIVGLLDNDPHKQGKRLYGTSLQVFSPETLRDLDNPWVILRAGAYNAEIKSQILNGINASAQFIE